MSEGGKRTRETVVPPSDFRCAFFKGAIITDTTILPLCRLSGEILHCCYSALNALALKLSFSAFFIKNASAL